jgi:TP901 family phage tail tape measure protein
VNRNIAVILSGRDAGLARTLGAAAQTIDRFNQQMDRAGTRGAKMASALKFGFAALGVAAAVGLGMAVKAAVDFEVQMQNVETVAHAGAAGIREMGDAVLNLSTEVPQATSVLTKGLYDIASSGFYGADALKVLEVSAIAASAGLSTTAVSSKAIVAVLNAYGLSAQEAADVSDIMFKTVELGVLTFEDLSNQLGDVIGAAAAAGIEFDEVGAAIATMTLAGLGADEAVVSLNRLIQKIIKPSKELSAAFRKLGFDSGAAALEQEGLYGTMELIRQATGGQITELIKLFPEIRAARGAYALMAAGGQHYTRVQAQITDETTRAGATQRAFNTQMEAVGNQFKIFANRVQVAGIRIGTVLLPVLLDAINLATAFGGRLGDAFSALGRMAAPALSAVGDAISEVSRLLEELGAVVSPAFRAFSTLAAGTVIAGLMAIANALEFVAGFLADHPGLVRAVAIAYGGVLVGRLLSAAAAFVKLHGGLLLIRAGLAGLSAQAVITSLVTRITALGAAIGSLAIGSRVAAIANLQTAFAGLGAVLASPAFLGTVAVAGLYAFQVGADRARRSAEELRTSIEKRIDFTSVQSIELGLQRINTELDKSNAKIKEYENVGGFFKFVAESVTPMENKLQDAAAASDELRDAMVDLDQAGLNLVSVTDQLQASLGITEEQARQFLDSLDFDPQAELTAERLGDIVNQAREMQAAARQGTPATHEFMGALETIADPAASAADRVNALSDAIAAFVETALGASNAAIGWEQAVDDLTGAVTENGLNLDINSQAGRDVASAINDATEAAVQHAQAVVEDTGNIQDGVAALTLHREQLVAQLQGFGMTRAAAEEYINQLGLTPENISTLVDLENMESAMLSLEQLEYMLKLVDDAETTARVNIDSSKFDDNAIKIAQALLQIEMAAPEAEVLLNGEKFTPTAEMVQQWAAHWDDSTPEAQALLDAIDPGNKFTTLSEAAAHWDAATPTATALVDAAPAHTSIEGAQEALFGWDRSSGTADANANPSQAHGALTGVLTRLGLWNLSSGTADANVKDNASSTLGYVNSLLDFFDGRTATATVTVYGNVTPSAQQAINIANNKLLQRLGGVVPAQGGLIQAGMVNQPTVLFGERATGGEAFIPRRGNVNRALQILNEAASWYGQEMRPSSQYGGGGGGIVIQQTLSVSVAARVDKDRVREVVDDAVQKNNTRLVRTLTRELGR